MIKKIYNFSAGPSPLPNIVREKLAQHILSNNGSSLIETDYTTKSVQDMIKQTTDLFREVAEIPNTHEILWINGSARLLFSAIPLNLFHISKGDAYFVDSGPFANKAAIQASQYVNTRIIAGTAKEYGSIPNIPSNLDEDCKYLHITYNNTTVGTAFQQLPDTGEIPLVVDCTSDLLSRRFDYSKVAIMYAGVQKNLGPSGLTVVVIRKDLLNLLQPHSLTPPQLHFRDIAESNSSLCTPNLFSILGCKYALEWIKQQGGITQIEHRNRQKAQVLYDVLDRTSLYTSKVENNARSIINVCFDVNFGLTAQFLAEAQEHGLENLSGYCNQGVRASIYNTMPIEGVKALANFMVQFENKYYKGVKDATSIGYY